LVDCRISPQHRDIIEETVKTTRGRKKGKIKTSGGGSSDVLGKKEVTLAQKIAARRVPEVASGPLGSRKNFNSVGPR